MNREQQYLLHLHNTTRYSVAKDELTLSYYDEKNSLYSKSRGHETTRAAGDPMVQKEDFPILIHLREH